VIRVSHLSSAGKSLRFWRNIDDANFVDRTDELNNLVRDLADGQKVFLLSPRRFGKSSLVAVALFKLKKRHIHTVNLTVSSYFELCPISRDSLSKYCVRLAPDLAAGRACFQELSADPAQISSHPF
jgi:AAA+ ATPase superfamily predicted ATPase